MNNMNLSNEIELVVLNFFQERRGFDEWWYGLDEDTRAAIEVNLIDRIYQHLNKTIHADAEHETEYWFDKDIG